MSGRDSSDQASGRLRKNLTFLPWEPWEPSINMSPRDQLTSERPLIGRPIFLTLASVSIAALIAGGATFAWIAGRPSTPDAAPQRAPVTQTAAAPTASATSPELVQQLEAMARDLTVLRHSVEQIAVKQERLAAAQEQLEQLAAKQEQMAQDIAKLQAVGQNIRQKLSPRPLSRTVPVSPSRNAPKEPKDTPPETAAQSSSVPRPEPEPRPPLPVPLVR
jgi:hypothetical protein